MPAYRIEEWSPADAPEASNRAHYALDVERMKDEWPEDPIEPFDVWFRDRVEYPSYQRPLRWQAISNDGDGDAAVLGVASLHLEYTDDNRHLSDFDIYVTPAARRHGIASALLDRVVDAARNDDRTLLSAGSADGSVGDAFLTALGAQKKSVERKSRLTIADVDRVMLEDWVARAPERAAGYSLISFDDRCPDDLLDAWVDLVMVMNTAPRDDLEMEDWVETPELYRERETKSLAKGYGSWRLIARHDATGELAGFTEFIFPPYSDEQVWQEGTGVRPAHRDKGLGRWLKAVNLLRLMDERPLAKYVDTWNAFSNGPMLGINITMGFEIVRGYAQFQIPTADLAESLKAKA